MEQLTPEEVKPQLPVRHHAQVAFAHRGEDRSGRDRVRGEVLKLDSIMMEERPHEVARRRPEHVAVELDEGDDVAFRRARLPVLRRRRDPFGLRRGSEGAEKPLLLQVSQPTLRHRQRAPLVGGDESHRHRLEHGRRDGR